MRLAVLDVGSNTVHLVVVDGQPDGGFVPVARERETLRLAEAAFPTMRLPEEAIERLTATVARMRDWADELTADVLVGFATSAIREARNGVEALGRVREATGVGVTVLPGGRGGLPHLPGGPALDRLLGQHAAGGRHRRRQPGDRRRRERPAGAGREPAARRDQAVAPVRAVGPGASRRAGRAPGACAGPVGLCRRDRPAYGHEVVCATSKTFRNLGELARSLPEAPASPHAFGFAGVDGQTAPVLTRETMDVVAGYLAGTTARQRGRLAALDGLRARNVVAGSQVAALVMQAFGLEQLVLAPGRCARG